MALLEVKNVTKQFGGLTALNDVSFSVEKGEIRGLIGPNGAGKSTMFKNIAGFYTPTKGEILYEGQNIAGTHPCKVSGMGLVRTFQETTLFDEMSVFENALVGCHMTAKTNLFSAILGSDRQRQKIAAEKTMEVLEFMGLADRKDQLASELPLGSQRALAMAVSLNADPKVLLMDEPFAGMNPEETNHMMDLTRKLQDKGITIVLVEHDMKAVMGLCGYLTVLCFGSLLAEGTPEEIRNNEKVIQAYLGGVLNMMLTMKDVEVSYKNIKAVKKIDIEVPEGGFVTLIGSNGAGKSTTLRVISGLVHPSKGEITYQGQRIDKLSADKILKLGIAHVPEGRRIFKDLTVEENLRLGAFIRNDKEEIEKDLEEIFERFPRLLERRTQMARSMSGGEQQMVSIGRALMSRPKLLMLDEPSLGLAPIIIQEIAKILVDINKQGVAVILVEQNAELALELAKHAYVLETGFISLEGEASTLMDNDHVRQAYLGM